MFAYLVHLLFASDEQQEREAREAYLADSADLVDLEYRIREWDRRTQEGRLFG